MLGHFYIKESMAKIMAEIGRVGTMINNSTKTTADRFISLAKYDKLKAEGDLKGARDLWEEFNNKIKMKFAEIQIDLDKIFKFSFALVGAEMAEKAADLTRAIMNTFNPFKLIKDADGTISDVAEAITKLNKAGAWMARVVNALKDVDKLAKLNKEIFEISRVSTEGTVNMTRILDGDEEFTDERARVFLKNFQKFGSSEAKQKVVEFASILDSIVGRCCDAMESADGAVSSGIEVAAAGKLPLHFSVSLQLHKHFLAS